MLELLGIMANSTERNRLPMVAEIKSFTKINEEQQKALFDEIVRVEWETEWPDDWRADKDTFKQRARIFPEGFFLAYDGEKLAGMSTSESVSFNPEKPPKSWDEVTGNGHIEKTHDINANSIYVVSVAVSRNHTGKGLGKKLVAAQKELTTRLNKEYLFLGARIPGYREFHTENPNISAQDYIKLGEDGKKVEPEIGFYEACGLVVKKVVPNYGPDAPSEDNGVIMVWKNPQFK